MFHFNRHSIGLEIWGRIYLVKTLDLFGPLMDHDLDGRLYLKDLL